MNKAAFELLGRVEAVLVAPTVPSLVSVEIPKIQAIRDQGIKGDRHFGTRLADVREKGMLAFGLWKGMEIANHRAFSAVSVAELTEIATRLGVPSIPYGSLGENIVVGGIPKFTDLPVGTRFFFRKPSTNRTAVLFVWAENQPCTGPGEAIQKLYPDIPGLASGFAKAAIGRRGVVGGVYCSGFIEQGDELVVRVPNQAIYDPR